MIDQNASLDVTHLLQLVLYQLTVVISQLQMNMHTNHPIYKSDRQTESQKRRQRRKRMVASIVMRTSIHPPASAEDATAAYILTSDDVTATAPAQLQHQRSQHQHNHSTSAVSNSTTTTTAPTQPACHQTDQPSNPCQQREQSFNPSKCSSSDPSAVDAQVQPPLLAQPPVSLGPQSNPSALCRISSQRFTSTSASIASYRNYGRRRRQQRSCIKTDLSTLHIQPDASSSHDSSEDAFFMNEENFVDSDSHSESDSNVEPSHQPAVIEATNYRPDEWMDDFLFPCTKDADRTEKSGTHGKDENSGTAEIFGRNYPIVQEHRLIRLRISTMDEQLGETVGFSRNPTA